MLCDTVPTCPGAHNLPFNEYRRSFPEVKRPQREVDYSPPSIANDKNKWSCTSAPLSVYMVWRGITLPDILRDLSVSVVVNT
jgi:hypothetical protein